MKRVAKLLLAVALVALAAGTLMAKNAKGIVVDSAGAPVAGAIVQLKGDSDASVRSFRTRDDGTFTFTGLNPDLYYSLKARVGNYESKQADISKFEQKDKEVELKFSVTKDQLK